MECSISILVEKGTVRVSGNSMNMIEHWEFADQRHYDQDIARSNTSPDSVYGYGHSGYYRNVIDCIANKAIPLSSGIEGRKSLSLLEQIYRKANQKK
jgi:UDP-N-acetyl-2-amino-2-deoxyglucuronate dehydrogenase